MGGDLEEEEEEHEMVKNLLLLGSLINGEVRKNGRFESEVGCRVQWTSTALERVAAMVPERERERGWNEGFVE